jgi:kynurenine 3-monooxygenase
MKLRTKATHTWPRPDSLLIAFPNPDNSFTLMFNLPLEGSKSFAELTTKASIETYIKEDFPDLQPLIPEIIHAFAHRPTGNFVTLYNKRWHDKDFMVLIGDAAHAVIPFYGQGMCAAFEDCLKLVELYDAHDGKWETIFRLYQRNRKKNTDILARLSKENFIELRDKSRSAFFTLKDKTDTLLHNIFPNFWQPPLYILIAHGNLEYDEALRRYRRQECWSKRFGLDLALHIAALPRVAVQKIGKIK